MPWNTVTASGPPCLEPRGPQRPRPAHSPRATACFSWCRVPPSLREKWWLLQKGYGDPAFSMRVPFQVEKLGGEAQSTDGPLFRISTETGLPGTPRAGCAQGAPSQPPSLLQAAGTLRNWTRLVGRESPRGGGLQVRGPGSGPAPPRPATPGLDPGAPSPRLPRAVLPTCLPPPWPCQRTGPLPLPG